MAKCKFCGAEVAIGARCTYCGSKAESWYYSGAEKKQAIALNAEYDDLGAGRKIFRGKYYIVQKRGIISGILQKGFTELELSITGS
mgnify:CR=1 FL=1